MSETRSARRGSASFATTPGLLIALVLAIAAVSIRCTFSDDDTFSNAAIFASGPSPSTETTGASVWAATGSVLVEIDAATDQPGKVLRLGYAPVDLALDPSDRSFWVLGPQHLAKFETTGRPVFERALADLAPGPSTGTHIAINPYDSSAWVSVGPLLLHVDARGALRAQWAGGADIRALALDLDERLWVLTEGELIHLSADLTVRARLSLADIHDLQQEPPFALALDPLGARVWLGSTKGVVQLDTVNLGVSIPVALGTNAPVGAMTVDVFSGTLWVIAGDHLFTIDRSARLVGSIDLAALGLADSAGIIFDPASRSLWLGAGGVVAHLSAEGGLLRKLVLAGRGSPPTTLIGVPALKVIPSVDLVDPLADAVTNNPTPAFRLELGAACNGKACDLGEAYRNGLAVSAELNGESVTHLLTRTSAEATYTPAAPLPEGVSTLTARAVDAFGRSSKELVVSITVDTTPPVFLSLTPPDGASFEEKEVLIEGALDDPQATVMLTDAAGSVLSVGASPFAFRVTLAPGVNTFRVIARDAAGNETAVTLNLVQGSSEIDVTSHPDGATVEEDHIILSGTFDGPANTGITVNGAVAQLFGNRFFASVPLLSGSNTLTIVMTRPDGTQVTRMLILHSTSSGSRSIDVRAQPASGIAPLKVTFTVINNSGKDLKKVEIDFDGDGRVDAMTTDTGKLIEHTYALAGVFFAKSLVTDTSGGTYRTTHAIVVNRFDSMEQMLRGVYTGMLDRLRVRDIAGALTFIAGSTQPKYEALFKALEPNLVTVVDKLGTIERLRISEEFAELTIVRDKNGERRAYFIYLLRSEDGVWRIESM